MENSYNIKNIESNKQRPITFRATKRYERKVSATCKILSGNEGSGFFCEIKMNNRLMKVLFTNNHVINNLNSDLIIEYNRKKKIIKLKNRFRCTNEELDYTCIEILEEDGINNYFKIDKNINNYNPYEEYKYDEFVMIQYPGGDDVSFAEGYINDIKDKNIFYTMNTEFGSSGSPLILDTRNLKIIGIHYSKSSNNNNIKKAIFMKYIIKDIEKQLKNYNNNNKFNNNFFNNTINNFNNDYFNNFIDYNDNNINNIMNNLNNINIFNDNDNNNKNKTLYNNPNFKNDINNNKTSFQNNNLKDIIQNNQIINYKPRGIFTFMNKTFELYSIRQLKENKNCW